MDTMDMEKEKINQMEIIDEIFNFNDEIINNKEKYEKIISSFLKLTPAPVIKMMLLEEVHINFVEREILNRYKDDSVLGSYYFKQQSIVVCSSMHIDQIISTMHHEIGHAVDYYSSNIKLYTGENLLELSSRGGKYIDKLRLEESHIYSFHYYRDSASEFFAQSYSEYVRKTFKMYNSNLEIKQVFKNIFKCLDLFYELGTHKQIKNFYDESSKLYLLDNTRFLLVTNEDDKYRVTLHKKGEKVKLLLKDLIQVQIYKQYLCDNEVIINAYTGRKWTSYYLKETSLLKLGGLITKRYYDKVHKTAYKFAILERDDSTVDILIKKNGKLFIKPYSFNHFDTILSENFIGYGIKDNTITTIGNDLNPMAVINGRYICKYEENVNEDPSLLVKDNDRYKVYNIYGENIQTYDIVKSLTGTEGAWYEVLINTNSYMDYLRDYEDIDDDYPLYEIHTEVLFLRSGDKSFIKTTIGKPMEVNFEDIEPSCDIVEVLEAMQYELTIENPRPVTENLFVTKVGNEWYYHNLPMSIPPSIQADEAFYTFDYSCNIFLIGIDYHDINKKILDEEHVSNVRIKSSCGEINLEDLTFSELLSFLELARTTNIERIHE